MYQRSRRACFWMLAASMCLRLCLALGLDARAMAYLSKAAAQPEFVRTMVYLETGQAAPLPEIPEMEPPDPNLWIVKLEPLPEPEPEALAIEAADAGEITVSGQCTYIVDKAALLARPSAMDLSSDGPQVLIVHTHSSEAYTPEPAYTYTASDSFRTQNTDCSVIRVGEELARSLTEAGISVIHDTSVNDYPDYNISYWNSLKRIENWLTQYPSIQMVLDIHRDAVEDDQGNAKPLSASADGQSCAQLMLVVGTDQGGLTHPNWQENLANALKLQAVLQAAHPGLCRDLDLRTERFNQHAAPGSLLIEVGTTGNTMTQALASARLLGTSVGQMLHVLHQNGGTLE